MWLLVHFCICSVGFMPGVELLGPTVCAFLLYVDTSGFIPRYKLTICPESPADVHQNGIVLHGNTAFNRFHSEVPQVSGGQSVLDHPLWRRSWEGAKLPMTLSSRPSAMPSPLSDPP